MRIPIRRHLKRVLASRLLVDLAGDGEDLVLVAGAGRSGTTWLANVIDHRGDHRLVFEPFAAVRVPLAAPFGPGRRYVPAGERAPERVAAADAILGGRVRGRWVDRYNTRLVARRRLVKAIRANLLLGWLAELKPRMRIVLLVRHPVAVALSRVELGWRGGVRGVLGQPRLVADHLAPYRRFLEGLPDDPVTDQLGLWAVENLVPLRALAPGRAHLVFYEHLVEAPEAECARLFAYLGRAPHPRRLRRAVRRPSELSRRASAARTGGDPLTAWRRSPLHAEAVERAAEIVPAMRLGGLYDPSEPRPRPGAAEAAARLSVGGDRAL